MDAYLDVDGVLLTKKGLRPARHLRVFLLAITSKHDIYWLSSHCKGDAAATLRYLRQFLPDEIINLLRRVKPTVWDALKTDGIDFSREFLWFDDYILQAEQEILRSRGRMESWVRVDLDSDPDTLLECVRLFNPPRSSR